MNKYPTIGIQNQICDCPASIGFGTCLTAYAKKCYNCPYNKKNKHF
jgi:hypothetical protein